jgi:hypothetical protein
VLEIKRPFWGLVIDIRLFQQPLQPLRVTAARRHEFFSNLSAVLEMLHCLAGGFCVRRTWAI